MTIAMADALFGIFGMRRVSMKVICPKAKRCDAKLCHHAKPHDKSYLWWCGCAEDEDCPACVPVKAKRKGKK
jgi:hypothetical protein